MSTLVDMLVPALTLSVLALVCTRLLSGAPPRLRLFVALAGLAAWVVPWPWIRVPVDLARAPLTGTDPIASIELDASFAVDALGTASGPLAYAALALLLPGLLWLARDCAAFAGSIRGLRRARRPAEPAEPLRALLPEALRTTRVEIRTVPGTRLALASGFLRPTIWIGDAFSSAAELELALVHECEHARRHDTVWIALITAVRRVLWWNPIVALLARDAVLMLETDCDRRSAAHLGRRPYVARLAALMLGAETASGSPLLAAACGRHPDVARLELLQRGFGLRWRHGLLVAAVAAAAAGLAASAVIETRLPAFSRVAIPGTPAGRALSAVLEAFASGDSALLGSYLGAYTPQELAWPLADFTDGVEVVGIVASEPRRIEYLLRDGRDGAVALGRLELADPAAATRAGAGEAPLE